MPVRVMEGLPQPFASVVNEHDDPLIWQLYLNRSVFTASVKGLQIVESHAGVILQAEPMQGAKPPSRSCSTHATSLKDLTNL